MEKWIQGAIKHPWALRKSLWVKKWEKIEKEDLSEIIKAKIWERIDWEKVTAKLKKRAVLARTLSKF